MQPLLDAVADLKARPIDEDDRWEVRACPFVPHCARQYLVGST